MGVMYNPKIITNGLLMYMDAANKKSYTGSGTSWNSLIGSSVATLSGSPTYNSTDKGGTFTFVSASSQFATSDINLDNSFSAGITMQAWIKATSYTVWNRIFSINDSVNNKYQYWIQTNATTGLIEFGTSPTSYCRGLTAVGIGNWVNIAATCNYGASSIKLYLNSVDDTGTPTGTPAYTADIGTTFIGKLVDNGVSSYGNYTFSLGKIYNRALSSEEIMQNFNATRGRFGV